MTQGYYTFPGILNPKEGVYSQSYGTQPDRIMLTFTNQASNIADGGDVTFYNVTQFATTSFRIPHCKVDQGVFEFNEKGFIEKAVLWDRRWRWRMVPKISIHLNEPAPDGVGIRPATEFSPQEMLEYLFGLLGEAVDVSLVPNASRPEIFYTCEDPADIIDDLVDQLSCRVVLGYNEDIVTVVPINAGDQLPNDATVSRVSIGWDPPEVPQYVDVMFADTIYQSRFKLLPVGRESVYPYEIKLLQELSYTPASGWGTYSNVEAFEDLGSPDDIASARTSVWRWFAMPAGPFTVPDLNDPLERFMIHPLRRSRAVFAKFDNESQVVDPAIWGRVYVENVDDMEVTEPGTGTNTSNQSELPVRFTLDTDNGIFKFQRPLRQILGGQNFDPELIAEVSYHARNPQTFANEAYVKRIEINPTGYGVTTLCVNVPRIIIGRYDQSHNLTGTTDNQDTLDQVAQEVVSDFAATLAAYESYVVHYNVLRTDIKPTGKVAQVTQIVSDTAGASTIAGQHMEWDTGAKTYVEKQRHRSVSRLRQATAETQNRLSRKRYRGDRVA